MRKRSCEPGHFVDVRVILSTQKNAILVPTEAVMIGQNGHYVFVVKADSTIAVQNVKIGQRYQDNKYISILSGVSSKDKLITRGTTQPLFWNEVEIKQP